MLKRNGSKAMDDHGADHLHDEQLMKVIEKDMLRNIHQQIRSKWYFLKLSLVKYALAASVLLICTVSYLLLSKRQAAGSLIYVSARNGHLSVVNLPDGSTIWLNSGSSISYPQKFSSRREVQLINGEAFFDVKHDNAHPFIVHYGNLHTQVLGTSFNIKYYPKLNDVRVTVIRGLVEVGSATKSFGLLKPNKEIVYSQKSKTFNVRVVNSQKVSAWKTKEINLYDVSFDDLIVTLENTYDIKIEYNHAAMQGVVTTIHFLSTDNLKQVLDMVATIHGLNYTITGKEVRLESK